MNTFTAGDRSPFTYVIVHKATGRKYYGARYSKGCKPSDLWAKYFTSSQAIRELIKVEGREAFQAEVRKVFTSVDTCLRWELGVLRRLKVNTNTHWYNKSAGGKQFYSVLAREQNPNFGKHWHTPQHIRDKISASMLGTVFSEEHNHKISLAMRGSGNPMFGKKHSEDRRKKISEANRQRTQSQAARLKISEAQLGSKNHRYGKQASPEQKARQSIAIKGCLWINNPITQIHKRIRSEEWSKYQTDGWVRGRIGWTWKRTSVPAIL